MTDENCEMDEDKGNELENEEDFDFESDAEKDESKLSNHDILKDQKTDMNELKETVDYTKASNLNINKPNETTNNINNINNINSLSNQLTTTQANMKNINNINNIKNNQAEINQAL